MMINLKDLLSPAKFDEVCEKMHLKSNTLLTKVSEHGDYRIVGTTDLLHVEKGFAKRTKNYFNR